MHYLYMWRDFKTLQVQTPAKERKRIRISATNGWCLDICDWESQVARLSSSWESQGSLRNGLSQVRYLVNLSEKLCSNSTLSFGYFHQKTTNICKCRWTAHFNYMFKDLSPPFPVQGKKMTGLNHFMISFSSLRMTLEIILASSECVMAQLGSLALLMRLKNEMWTRALFKELNMEWWVSDMF